MSKFNDILTAVNRTAHKVGFKIKKHSPEIFVVAGVAGVVTSTVMACKATTKASAIMEDHKKQVETIHKVRETQSEKYADEDMKKDTVIVYSQTVVKLVKTYGPAVAVGVASIACILGSHKILTKRNAALAAAYTTVDTAFKEYRGRVVERFGKELDKELRYNIKAKEVDVVTVDENGNETTVKTTVEVADNPNRYSDFTRCFDVGCTGWTKDPEMNLMFLRRQQDYANEMLKSKGHLFLNEVYDMLGFQRTQLGQIAGWVYENPNGDGYIDFGIYDIHDQTKRDFVNGYERSIWLDFNVDGNILDLI